MATSIVMPALEMAQETGKIVSWLKKEGDLIVKGEPILEVETDKAVVEIEATADGILAGVTSHEGDVVPVGQTIAWVVAPGEKPPAASAAAAAPAARTMTEPQRAPAASSPKVPADQPAAGKMPDGGAQVSPKARRLAKERGVDLSGIRGTGPGGTITSEDVMAAAAAPATAPPVSSGEPAAPDTVARPNAVGRLMAERTTQSWTQAPHFFLVREIDAGGLMEARAKLGPAIERDRGVKLTFSDLLVSLVARVLARHPRMNASWVGEGVRLNPSVNISLAVAVEGGVVGVVLPEADAARLGDIAVQRRDLSERARATRLRTPDITGGTFTITNLGMYGIDSFSAIIPLPQAAILAVGRIADRVVPVVPLDGGPGGGRQPGIRPMMTLTLSSDHRVVDGAQAAVFLSELAEAIGNPQELLA